MANMPRVFKQLVVLAAKNIIILIKLTTVKVSESLIIE